MGGAGPRSKAARLDLPGPG